MTGLAQWQVTELVTGVFTLLGGWQRPRGRRRVVGLYRAVVLTLFLLRHDNAQHVAGELFGRSQSTVSRIFRRIRPLLDTAAAAHLTHVSPQAQQEAVLVDGFIAPTGERAARDDLFSGKHRIAGMNVQVVADLGGRLLDTGAPVGGSRHDTVAFLDSGIAARWKSHLSEDGPGMLADKGYQGAGPITPYRKTTGQGPVRGAQDTQHRTEQPARGCGTRHFPGQLEDPRHRLPRAALGVPRAVTHRNQPGDLPNLGIEHSE
jgi:DDE superfamily endonuclease